LVAAGFALRFPAALVLNPWSFVCEDGDPCPSNCEAVGVVRFDPERFDAATNPTTRWPESDPVEDCELCLRTITGFLLEAAVAATTFLPVLVAVLVVTGGTGGGGGISATGATDVGDSVICFARVGPVTFGAGNWFVEGVPCLFFTNNGNGGGGISAAATAAVLVGVASPSWIASSPEVGGDAKRAVGRGPDEEGPLDFFKIGWGGGGLEDEGVSPLLPLEREDAWSEVSCGRAALLPWPLATR
jgi:hypothetical protein